MGGTKVKNSITRTPNLKDEGTSHHKPSNDHDPEYIKDFFPKNK
jgi:hypothetical protein